VLALEVKEGNRETESVTVEDAVERAVGVVGVGVGVGGERR